jgi:hypothetical protein
MRSETILWCGVQNNSLLLANWLLVLTFVLVGQLIHLDLSLASVDSDSAFAYAGAPTPADDLMPHVRSYSSLEGIESVAVLVEATSNTPLAEEAAATIDCFDSIHDCVQEKDTMLAQPDTSHPIQGLMTEPSP